MASKDAPALQAGAVVPGDCLETMAAWPADSVDLIFADPPYNIGFTYDQYEDARSDEEYVDWTCRWIDACSRLLKPSGSFYILIGDEYAAETRLHLKQLERKGDLLMRNWIVWHYTFGQRCKAKFNRSHAHLFYCVGSAVYPDRKRAKAAARDAPLTADDAKFKVDATPFTFNYDAVAVASARATIYGDKRANSRGKLPDDTWYLRPQETEGEHFNEDSDTWYVSRLCGTFKERQQWHPCQLPEALLDRIVKVSSNPGDIVFDPFTGSGTTLAVAHKLHRQWVGCELSEDYAARATERIANTPQVNDPHAQTKLDVVVQPRDGRRIAAEANLFKS